MFRGLDPPQEAGPVLSTVPPPVRLHIPYRRGYSTRSFSPFWMKLAAVYAGLVTVCQAVTPPAQPNVITLL